MAIYGINGFNGGIKMANFVEALGRSQALTSAISGIQGIQQGELAIKNQESQQAINEHNLKKIKEEEAAGERLIPIGPAFGRLTPSVKDFWGKTAQPYMVKGTSGENYIKAKDMPRLMQTIGQDKEFRLHTYKLTLTDTMAMQQKLNKLLEQAKSGEGETKMNDKQIAELQADIAKVNQQKYYLDNVIAMHEGRKAKEDFTLSQGETRFSGTGEQIATGGVKPTDLPAGLDEFEAVSGINPNLRGTSEYKQAYIKFLQEKDKATTKPVDVTDKDEKTYSRILAQSNSDAWRRTQAKFPKSGMSFNFTTGEMSTGGTGDPAALDFYEQERNKAVTARLKKVGLHKKYGDLHNVQAPTDTGVMNTMPPAGQHKGKIVKDTDTGKRYKSDGKAWVEVK